MPVESKIAEGDEVYKEVWVDEPPDCGFRRCWMQTIDDVLVYAEQPGVANATTNKPKCVLAIVVKKGPQPQLGPVGKHRYGKDWVSIPTNRSSWWVQARLKEGTPLAANSILMEWSIGTVGPSGKFTSAVSDIPFGLNLVEADGGQFVGEVQSWIGVGQALFLKIPVVGAPAVAQLPPGVAVSLKVWGFVDLTTETEVKRIG